MHTGSFRKILIIAIVLLAFSGAAEAAIASSGGGLSSAMTGAGTSSAASSVSAGHSASVAKTLTQTLVAAGSFSTTTGGTQSATDGTVTVNVAAANLRITGFLDGPGTVISTARVAANGDENLGLPISDVWVRALVEAQTAVTVTPGVHGTATASATGTATARGYDAGVGTVTATASGTTTASSDARDLFANGAYAWSQGRIWADSSLYTFGTGIGIDELQNPIFTEAITMGGGTASATASGSSVGTATSATGSGSVIASGRTTADTHSTGDKLSTGITFGWGCIDAEFRNYDGNLRYATLNTWIQAIGVDNPGFPDYHGTASGSATGTATVNGRDALAGAMFRDTASGRVASTATQDGVGIAFFDSNVFAADGGLGAASIILDIPRATFGETWSANPTAALGTSWGFTTTAQNLDDSEVSCYITVAEQGGRGTGSSSASGSASTSTTIGAFGPGILGDRTATSANGQTSISGTVDGGVALAPDTLTGRGVIVSQAMTEGTTDYYDLTVGGPALGTFDDDAGAVSVVNGHMATNTDPDVGTSFTGTVSANGQTSATAVNDGVIAADAASRAGGNIQGRLSGQGIANNPMSFGAESYGYAFTGSWETGGDLFGMPSNEFAIAESGIEARAMTDGALPGTPLQSVSARLTGGTAHGDAGNDVTGIRSIGVRSDTTGSTDASGTYQVAEGVSQTLASTRQIAAYFPVTDGVTVNTVSSADILSRVVRNTPDATTHGSASAALTGVRTSGAGSYDSFVPGTTFSVSSDGLLSGGMRVTETTAGAADGSSETFAASNNWGFHAVTAAIDQAQVSAWYAAYTQGLDAENQRGTAQITGLTLAGHGASEADTARLTLAGGSATVNLNTLANSATITFPIRTATLGGSPAATLGMAQGVRTDSSVTAPGNFAYAEWAGIADSQIPAVVPPYPI